MLNVIVPDKKAYSIDNYGKNTELSSEDFGRILVKSSEVKTNSMNFFWRKSSIPPFPKSL
jgi:hypothetical protein